jgi:Spy/CpxP family protein refolding chaperone
MSRDARPRIVAWALAVLLLVVGAAAGVAGDRLLFRDDHGGARRGPPSTEEILQRMTRDLELTDAQANAIGAVLDTRRRELSTLFARVDPEAEAIRHEAHGKIRALLEPAQRARFDAQVAEGERRRAELRERFGPSRTDATRPRGAPQHY